MDEVQCPPTPLVVTDVQSPKAEPESPRPDSSPKPPPEEQTQEQTDEKKESKDGNRESPEPNCAICLGKLQNKSFTDSCFHQFCFTCLLEWSKIKAECPLCKQHFKSIIHNVRSIEDYDQYHLQAQEPVPTSLSSAVDRRFRYRSTLTAERRHEIALEQLLLSHSFASDAIIPPQRLNSRSLWRRRRQVATSEFRRRVYLQDLWVRPVSDVTGRYRETSPEFFRNNPATTHRLVPWLNRELNILLYNHSTHVAYVLDLIMDLITRYDINSAEFRQHLIPYFGLHTNHFIHEFYQFARSPFDMIGYDQYAQYGPSLATEVQGLTSESSDEDVDVIVLSSDSSPSPLETRTLEPSSTTVRKKKGTLSRLFGQSSSQRKEGRKNSQSGVAASSSASIDLTRSLSPLPGPSGLNQIHDSTTSSDSSDDSDGSSSDPTGKRKTRGYVMPKKEPVATKNESDDCEIVGYVKPRHERTPEIITLSSGVESDLDVEREEEVPFAYDTWSEEGQCSESEPSAIQSSGSEWTPGNSSKTTPRKKTKSKRLPSTSHSDDVDDDDDENNANNYRSGSGTSKTNTTNWESEDHTYWKKALRVKYNKNDRPSRSRPLSTSSDDSSDAERRTKHKRKTKKSKDKTRERKRVRNAETLHDHDYHLGSEPQSSYNPPYSASEIISFMEGGRPKLRIRSIVLPKSNDNGDSSVHSDTPTSSSLSSRKRHDRSSSQSKRHRHNTSHHKHKHKKKKHKRRKSSDSHSKHKKKRKTKKLRSDDSSS